MSNLRSGYLIRGLNGKEITESLSAGQVSRIFKSAAKAAGINPCNISWHSTRIGAAQDLLAEGKSIGQIMAKVGWSKVDTVIRYAGLNRVEAINLQGQWL